MTFLTGNTPQQEADAQNATIDAMSRRINSAIRRHIVAHSREIVQAYSETGNIPTDNGAPNIELGFLFADIIGMAFASSGQRIIDAAFARKHLFTVDGGQSFGTIGSRLEHKGFNELFERLIDDYVNGEAIRQRIASISRTTREVIIGRILRGQDEGLSVDQIARQVVEDIPQMSRIRANTIARTESHTASNYAANEAARATGLKLKKEWISVHDSRTRSFEDEYNHLAMDGQTVEMDQPFSMPTKDGGAIGIMFAGDPDAPIGATINCRCAVGHVVDDGF